MRWFGKLLRMLLGLPVQFLRQNQLGRGPVVGLAEGGKSTE